HRGEDIVSLGIEVTHNFAKPALGGDFVWLTGVPDVHRAKMRVVRVGIAKTVDDGHLALVVETLDSLHLGVKPYLIINRQHLLRRDMHGWAIVVIERVRI